MQNKLTMKLTNEEIARVFAMYWGCKTTSSGPFSNVNATILDIAQRGKLACQLHLTPLSAITDEHKNGIAKMYGGVWGKLDNDNFFQVIDEEGNVPKWFIMSQELPTNMNQQLILWGYAVPLYFGINHPCNGKTAIELGIAIEAGR